MSSINAATNPGNFIELVNKGMALKTPTPQFWFAAMAMGATMRNSAISNGMSGAAQYVEIITGNGAPISPELAALVRAADAYPGMIATASEFGREDGDTMKLRRPVYGGGGYTEDARAVQPDKATSTTGQTVRSEDVTITLKQFEGPGAADGTVKPYEILAFDAKYRKNANSLASETAHHLAYDYTVWKDTVLRDRTASSQYVSYSGGLSTVSTMTLGAGYFINLRMILAMRKALRDRNWQPFSNGRYICLVPTAFSTQIPDDFEYLKLSQNHAAGRNVIFSPVASIQDIDIFELSTLRSWAAGSTIPGATGTVQTGTRVHEALMFGPGILGHGTGDPPRTFWGDDTNFQKSAKMIWRSVEGFQTLDERGIQRGLFQEDV